jgi:hypothetical protein
MISGGFYDLSRDVHLSGWFKPGKANGVKITFEGGTSPDGSPEISGVGAGLGTVGAALNNMYEYLEYLARSPSTEEHKDLSGGLPEGMKFPG